MTKPTKPVISQTPVPPPQRGEPRAIFATKANNYILWQINALYPYNAASVNYMDTAMDYAALQVDEAQAQVALAADQVTLAANQATIATNQADIATQQAGIALGASNYKGLWIDLSGPLNKPASVGHNNQIWVLNNNLTDVTASEPSDSNPDWFSLGMRTTKPRLSSNSLTINEYDSAQITIIDYNSELEYSIVNNNPSKVEATIDQDKINIEALGVSQNETATLEVRSRYTGVLAESPPAIINVSVVDVALTGDYAIQIVDFSNEALYNDGFYNAINAAWDITAATLATTTSLSAQNSVFSGLFFKPDGTKMYAVGLGGDRKIYEYNLTSPWRPSTKVYVRSFDISAHTIVPSGLFFKPDGTKMYLTASGSVLEYSLSSGWDTSTLTYVRSFDISAQTTERSGLFFKPDGTRMYISGGGEIFEYSLSSGWDTSTLTYVRSFDISAQAGDLRDLFFKPDGTRMYVGDRLGPVHEYSLSSSWDTDTLTYVRSVSIGDIRALVFKLDGTSMYIMDGSNDSVREYFLQQI